MGVDIPSICEKMKTIIFWYLRLRRSLLLIGCVCIPYFLLKGRCEVKDLIFLAVALGYSFIDAYLKNNDDVRGNAHRILLDIHVKLFQLQYSRREGIRFLPTLKYASKLEFGNFMSLCMSYLSHNKKDKRFSELFKVFSHAENCLPDLKLDILVSKHDNSISTRIEGFPLKNSKYWISYRDAVQELSKHIINQLGFPKSSAIEFDLYENAPEWLNAHPITSQIVSELHDKLEQEAITRSHINLDHFMNDKIIEVLSRLKDVK